MVRRIARKQGCILLSAPRLQAARLGAVRLAGSTNMHLQVARLKLMRSCLHLALMQQRGCKKQHCRSTQKHRSLGCVQDSTEP
jgi:hypothetical protein